MSVFPYQAFWLHSKTSSHQDTSSLASWQQLFQWDGAVNLPASEEPQTYKQVGAPPLGHSLSLASSPFPQEAGPTSISRNLWQGSRTHRWSTPFRRGESLLQMQRGGETSPGSSGRKLIPLRLKVWDRVGETYPGNLPWKPCSPAPT